MQDELCARIGTDESQSTRNVGGDTDGFHQNFFVIFVIECVQSLLVAVLFFGKALDADGNGLAVVVVDVVEEVWRFGMVSRRIDFQGGRCIGKTIVGKQVVFVSRGGKQFILLVVVVVGMAIGQDDVFAVDNLGHRDGG